MSTKLKLLGLVFAFAALPAGEALANEKACDVTLSQEPLVMRLSKDEFRIAFGLNASSRSGGGCSGSISYNTTWETEDGTTTTERKTVHFAIPEGAARSLSVDRSYFDTAEAAHTTNVVAVEVDRISCDVPNGGIASR